MDAWRRGMLGLCALLLACCATLESQPSGASRDLAPTGTLRAAINVGNPVLARLDDSGKPVGVSVDLAHEVANRLGLPIELIDFRSAGDVVEAIKADRVDLAFVALDPVRAADLAYTAPYVIIEGTYLVRADSPLQHNEDVDRPDTRVAVGRASAYDLFLSRQIKSASLVRMPTSTEVTDQFLSQGLDVAAGVKQQLQADAARIGGLRLLPGRFMVIEQALAVPKGRVAAQAWLWAFVEDAKASGFVAASLRRHGVEGATVAPGAGR